ncbi:o-succinylbenzoate synthase [Rhodoluna sp. KAS3]|uniref:o-succinylbenzoate synthase n=1 Tax=Rhodoluna sp. KAS3 TaxID=942880 RepID=UPI0022319BDA|nr:o-succinylbenzoate synthase [Rhodoluna sp. KAS3]BDS49565.1 o-succinylbenzoate synthase [Rhodoluna sp. KAS3]
MTSSASNLPPLIEILSSARVVALPLRTSFRGLTEREALLFEGPNGWAEWSPFVEYHDAEAAVWLAAAIEFAYGQLPPVLRDRIPVNATLPAVAPDQVVSVLSKFGAFRTVKIKVAQSGQDLNQDLQRIWAARQNYPDARIRLDANGGYSVAEAVALACAMVENGVPLDYLEQPVASIAELAELRREVNALGVLIAADESVRKVTDPMAVVAAGAADILVLKAAPLGGVGRALNIAAEAGLPVVVSSALDTSVGLSMGAYLAAALPNLDFDCGLGTAALLAGDVTRQPLLPVDGFIDVRRVEVDEAKLDIFEAEDHRIDWWIDRLDRCFKLLQDADYLIR